MRRIVLELGTRALFFLCGCAAAIILAHGVGLLRRPFVPPPIPDAHIAPRAVALKITPSELRREIQQLARGPPGDPNRDEKRSEIIEALLRAVEGDAQLEHAMRTCVDRARPPGAIAPLAACVDLIARP